MSVRTNLVQARYILLWSYIKLILNSDIIIISLVFIDIAWDMLWFNIWQILKMRFGVSYGFVLICGLLIENKHKIIDIYWPIHRKITLLLHDTTIPAQARDRDYTLPRIMDIWFVHCTEDKIVLFIMYILIHQCTCYDALIRVNDTSIAHRCTLYRVTSLHPFRTSPRWGCIVRR